MSKLTNLWAYLVMLSLGLASPALAANINVSGTITAITFAGDGSGLTNLPGGGGTSDRIISGTTGMYTYVNTKATIATAGVERMVVNSTGEIGIAQQPLTGSALTVSGSLRAARTAPGSATSGGTIFANTQNDPTAADQRLGILAYGSIGAAGTHYPAAISAWSSEAYSSTNAGGYLAFETQNTATSALRLERMRIAPNGNVGLGTTDPSYTLDITPANNYMRLRRNASAGDLLLGNGTNVAGNFSPSFYGRVAGATVFSTILSEILSADDTGTVPALRIGSRVSPSALLGTRPNIAFANNTRVDMLLDANGNVGIGTTTPTAVLEVNGMISTTVAYFTGSAVSRGVNKAALTSFNWLDGNVQYTTANCGAMTFTNMADGGAYTLIVKGTTSGTCSFTHSGLTVHMPTDHAASTASKHTIYSFLRAGTDLYVTWIPGL